MCSSCYRETLNLHNSASAINNLQKKYQDRALLRTNFIQCAAGGIFPGADRFFKDEPVLKSALAMLLSSVVIGAFYWAFTFHASYPSRAILNPIYPASALLIYNIVAIVKNVKNFAAFAVEMMKKK